ncbi:unnamed protein product [Adineta steineri]|uniref:Phosphatidylinositol-glycan biosynthesis class X protein n=1 Tax=Adineta steineri TaxID=433720 RepID=A0A814VCU1_9BILA|nr:unnamed protein product [Adineta steineri]
MSLTSLCIFFFFLPCIIISAPNIGSRYTGTGFHTRLEYTIDPDPSMPARCLFVWHRLPPYLYIEPDELHQLNATILGSINIETSASQSHPFAYCFILYNSTTKPFDHTKTFSINIHSRYLDPRNDNTDLDPRRDDTDLYETLPLPEPVIHFTKKQCPHLGVGCPAPIAETGIESPRELTVTIPVGQEKHLWFVFPITCLFPFISCSLLFIISGRIQTKTVN